MHVFISLREQVNSCYCVLLYLYKFSHGDIIFHFAPPHPHQHQTAFPGASSDRNSLSVVFEVVTSTVCRQNEDSNSVIFGIVF
jgi:hypothetical protein